MIHNSLYGYVKIDKIYLSFVCILSAVVTLLFIYYVQLHNKDILTIWYNSIAAQRISVTDFLPKSSRYKALKNETCDSWRFNQHVWCPKALNISRKFSKTRRQISITCPKREGYKIQVDVNIVMSSNKIIPVLQFGEQCLHTTIDTICQTDKPVPNIVHYVWLGRKEMNFYHFLSIWSAAVIINPCLILIHGDELPYGRYWDFVLQEVPNIIHVNRSAPVKIHNRVLVFIEHKADIARMEAVKEYGGIYLDTDEIILRPVDHLRKYKFTMSHAFDYNLSNGVILSEKNATFLHYWFKAYKDYTPQPWGHFSTVVPFKLSKVYPGLLHVENKTFVNPDYDHLNILFRGNYCWAKNNGIHLFIRKYKKEHNFNDVRRLNTTIGSVARFVLYGERNLCSN